MRKDLTEGSIIKTIIVTSLPMVVALLLETSFNIVDAIYVGRISAEAIAAVSLAFPLMFFMYSVAGGIGTGATALIAKYVGSKEVEKADNVAEHAILLVLAASIVITILGLMFGKQLLIIMGAGSLTGLALSYLNVIFIGAVSMIFFSVGCSIFRGEGDTKTPMKFMVIATIANIILDPIFIFLLGMGVRGAAIATVIADTIGVIAVIAGFTLGKSSVKINLRHFKFNYHIFKDILKIGVPASLSQMSMSVSLFIMMKIVSYFGPYAIAAFGITSRLDSIAVLPALGLMIAAVPIVGQSLGAKKFERIEKVTYSVIAISAAFTGIVGLIFFAFPKMFISIFNTNPDVLRYGIMYLRTVGLAYAFIGIGIGLTGTFLGTGNSITSLVLTLLRSIILVIPLSLLLAFTFNLGVLGIWLAYAISIAASGVISFLWFKTGRWKRGYVGKDAVQVAI